MKPNYTRTIRACFIGYIVQAVVNNFAPLLFLTFQSSYGIPLSKITLLVTINFGLQLLVDLLSVGFVDKIGYRASAILAHGFVAAGLCGLSILPGLFADPFTGLLISVLIYACGGGLLEVLISPIVEACPTDNKEKTMSLLHSFYCWGHVGVILLSTLFFVLVGIEHWRILALLWAVIPLLNAVYFTRVPIVSLADTGKGGMRIAQLVKSKVFWVFMFIMLCAGASEQAVGQWASTFAERGLGVTKTIGDLAGPMFFAAMMGVARLIYGKYGDRLNLNRFMMISTTLCISSYLVVSLSASPVLGLIGCGLCGLSVGILWPGTFSLASAAIRGGGTAMFAFLALAGDLGCAAGPTAVGFISSAAGDSLKTGILVSIAFPLLLLLALLWKKRIKAS